MKQLSRLEFCKDMVFICSVYLEISSQRGSNGSADNEAAGLKKLYGLIVFKFYSVLCSFVRLQIALHNVFGV